MATQRVVVIGAGIAGLVTSLELATRGVEVIVVERADHPGGKMREISIGDARIDAGPTVFTMRWVFEEIFAGASSSLAAHLTLTPVRTLARHAWSEYERLDLFADVDESAAAIGEFSGVAEARRYREFCARAKRIFDTLEEPFIRAPEPSLPGLVRRAGLRGLGNLWRISPFATLWRALGEHFHDVRLRQLFARYATYCGSSPFLAPATLMLVAHVEREGVWLVEGGMHSVAVALARLATAHGACFRYSAEVAEVFLRRSRVGGVMLATGERIEADAVVVNADVAAVAASRFGHQIAAAVAQVPPTARSLSAVTWAMVAACEGFPLLRHTVFFSNNYAAEFDDIFLRSRTPANPTVYVCAQDRDDTELSTADAPERIFCLINAPAIGDAHRFDSAEIARCEASAFGMLERCGLRVYRQREHTVVTTPTGFERLFPATGGALYGQASHGWRASFTRPGCRTRIPGLYLAGGSAHPGPGVPMAALSGRIAAVSLLEDLARSSFRVTRE